MKLKHLTSLIALTVLSIFNSQLSTFAQGSLTPPDGTPAPVMKSLDQIEARIPVNTLSGSSNAMYVISTPGSYYLTGPIISANGKSGVRIDASHVVLDLNGFSIGGTNSFLGYGIFSSGSISNLTVRNGLVRQWGRGIQFYYARNVVVEDLQISECSGEAIYVWGGGIVRNVTIDIAGLGIVATGTNGWLVKDCSVSNLRLVSNSSMNVGIWVEPGKVESCVLKNFKAGSGNGEVHGIRSPVVENCIVDGMDGTDPSVYLFGISGALARGCLVKNMTGYHVLGFYSDQVDNSRAEVLTGNSDSVGISAKEKVTFSSAKSISGAFAYGITGVSIENCMANTITGAGFQVWGSVLNSTVQNAKLSGSGIGIYCNTAGARIEGNTVLNCDTGIKVTVAGSAVMRNTARGNTTNFTVNASSVCPIATAAQAATATNPLINLSL